MPSRALRCRVAPRRGTEDIGRLARGGTTKPTLYARSGSKEALYAAAVRGEYELLKERLFAAYAGDEPAPFRARLRVWTGAYFEFARDRPDGFQLISEGERYPAAA